ncbi:MFS transporter [Solwaraspora sp. WMMB335]|uniref:MFS transporter n=1 Tax=Solwaraspora sp. WMMB335 TaxID=3404118 RepID=UPI003B939227
MTVNATDTAGPTAGTGLSTAVRVTAIAVVLAGVFVSSLDMFIVNIAFPNLEKSFPASSLGDLSWVLSAYAIAFAAFLLPAGRWADRSGRKRAYLVGLILFTLASAACAFAPSLGFLVAGRVLQAIGGALMLPSSLGLMLPLFPPGKRGAAVGLWSAIGGAAAAGPPIGGLLVQIDWRWVFLVNLPVGLVAVLLGLLFLPEIRERGDSRRPDVLGVLVFAVTVATIVAAIVQDESWGWTGWRVLSLFSVGLLGLLLTAWRAARHPAPVIEPAILRIRAVALADLASVFFFGGFGAMVLSITLFMTGVWHDSVLRAGLQLAAGPVAAAVFAVPGGLLAARFGPRLVGTAGAVLFAVSGAYSVWTAEATPDYYHTFFPGLIIGGVGIGLVLPSLSAAATLPLPPERFATGTGMLSVARQVGLALGVAIVAAMLDVRPDLDAFDNTWWFMAGCSLAAGITLLKIGADGPWARRRTPTPS